MRARALWTMVLTIFTYRALFEHAPEEVGHDFRELDFYSRALYIMYRLKADSAQRVDLGCGGVPVSARVRDNVTMM